MILYIAKSRSGWTVLSGADPVQNFDRVEEARSFAAELRDEAAARGEHAVVVDVAESASRKS